MLFPQLRSSTVFEGGSMLPSAQGCLMGAGVWSDSLAQHKAMTEMAQAQATTQKPSALLSTPWGARRALTALRTSLGHMVKIRLFTKCRTTSSRHEARSKIMSCLGLSSQLHCFGAQGVYTHSKVGDGAMSESQK